MGTGQQPVGRTRAATAAQAGGSGDRGQRAKWARLMMLLRTPGSDLRLRERFSSWAGFRVVLTQKESTRCAKHTRRGESRGETPVRTKQRLAQTRAGQTRGRGSRSRRHRPPRERWEEARGGRRPQPTMEDARTSRQTTQGRRRGGGADAQGETREGAVLCGDQQEDVRRDFRSSRSAGTRGTMWKTALVVVLVPTHREDNPGASRRPHPQRSLCTKIARAGTCSFLPISQ